jgi:hypothetical protein
VLMPALIFTTLLPVNFASDEPLRITAFAFLLAVTRRSSSRSRSSGCCVSIASRAARYGHSRVPEPGQLRPPGRAPRLRSARARGGDARACRAAWRRRTASRYRRRSFDDFAIAGTAEECADRIGTWRQRCPTSRGCESKLCRPSVRATCPSTVMWECRAVRIIAPCCTYKVPG